MPPTFSAPRLICHAHTAPKTLVMVSKNGFEDDVTRKSAVDAMAERLSKRFFDVRNISPAQLVDMQQQEISPVTIVDTRTPEEFEVSRIPGGVTMEQFESRKAESCTGPIVAYCTIGYRSSQFAEKLSRQGCDAYNLSGGILGWTHAGMPLVTDNDGAETPTKRIHVFGEQWAQQPTSYEPVVYKNPMISLGKATVFAFFSKLFS